MRKKVAPPPPKMYYGDLGELAKKLGVDLAKVAEEAEKEYEERWNHLKVPTPFPSND